MSIKKKIFIIIILFILIASLAWYFLGGTRCIALKVSRQNAIKGITVTGNVESAEDVQITSEVTARIEQILIETGNSVETGQILAYLNREDLIGDVIAAEAKIQALQEQQQRTRVQYQDALSDEKRYENLYQEGAVSQRDLEERTLRRQELEESIDQIQQEIRAARGELKSVKGKLSDYIIKAPISGIITDSYVSTGDIVTPQQPLFRLVAPETIYLEADVEEDELDSVKTGQKALIIFDAYPDEVFEGKVYLISQEVNPVTGTFEARITRPDSPSYNIYVGMTFDATIIVEEYKNILIIPTDFIETENSKAYVFKLKNDFAVKKPVKIEFFSNNAVRILQGVKEGEIVLKKDSTGKLKDKEKVKIIEYRE